MFPLKDNIPTDRFPVVTVVLIAMNIAMYLLFQKAGIAFSPDNADFNERVIEYGAIPYEFTNPGEECDAVGNSIACEGQPGVSGEARDQPPFFVTAFTSMFMHGGLLHIAGNMLFLWIFGNNVEDSMGRVRFVAFYLLAGLAALAGQILVGTDSAIPTIGASGAVAGILGGYLLLFPRARVLTVVFIVIFFTVIELPALLFLLIWFGQQLLFGAADLTNPVGEGGGVAYFAHIGGFVFGLLLIKVFAQRRKTGYDSPRHPVY